MWVLWCRSCRSLLGGKDTLLMIAAFGAFLEANRREGKRMKSLETTVDGLADVLEKEKKSIRELMNELNSLEEIDTHQKKQMGELKQELKTLQMKRYGLRVVLSIFIFFRINSSYFLNLIFPILFIVPCRGRIADSFGWKRIADTFGWKSAC